MKETPSGDSPSNNEIRLLFPGAIEAFKEVVDRADSLAVPLDGSNGDPIHNPVRDEELEDCFLIDKHGILWWDGRVDKKTVFWDADRQKWVFSDQNVDTIESMNAPAPTIAPPKPAEKPQTAPTPPRPAKHPNPFRRKTPNPHHKPAPEKMFQQVESEAGELMKAALGKARGGLHGPEGTPGFPPSKPAPTDILKDPEERTEVQIGEELIDLARKHGAGGVVAEEPDWEEVYHLGRELVAMHGKAPVFRRNPAQKWHHRRSFGKRLPTGHGQY